MRLALSKSYHFNMKRSRNYLVVRNSPKKRRINKWISPTNLKNYITKDPLIDYYKTSQRESVAFTSRVGGSRPATFLQNQGIVFENEVYNALREKFPNDIINIDGSTSNPQLQTKGFKATKKAIRDRIPIIYQGVLVDKRERLRGVPDLLVRADFIAKIISNPPDLILEHPEQIYVVIDIKFSTLRLRADGIHLLNAGMISQYKAQTWLYTKMLNKLQPPLYKAFLLGRRWHYTSRGECYSGESCFDKLAVIDFETVDETTPYNTTEAITWVRDCRRYHNRWDLEGSKIPRDELYPNMCNHGTDFNKDKRQLAEKLGEITMIWNCGPADRDKAHALGIMSWHDPRLSAEVLDFKGNRAAIINKILNINRQNTDLIRPSAIPNMGNWQDAGTNIEFYIDFEASGGAMDDFGDFPKAKCKTTVFMINIGYTIISGDKRIYKVKQISAPLLTEKSELYMFQQMVGFINQMSVLHNTPDPLLFHWGVYEVTQWNRIEHRLQTGMVGKWFNMHKFFILNQIVVKDCFGYSLKQVVPAMYNHGLIATTWNTTLTGSSSDQIANDHYNNGENTTWAEFTDYNQTDTLVLWEIMSYLRQNHIEPVSDIEM